MSGHKGLAKWFKQDWVDIGSKKKGGGFKKCGRSKQKADAKRKYPKCVPDVIGFSCSCIVQRFKPLFAHSASIRLRERFAVCKSLPERICKPQRSKAS